MLRLLLLALILLLNCPITMAARAGAPRDDADSSGPNFHWKVPEYIKKSFIEVALNNEYSTKKQRVRKWQKPIKLWIEHKVADKAVHTYIVQMHVKHLSLLTGLPIELVDSKAKANVTLIFTQQSVWKQDVAELLGLKSLDYIRDAVCMASFKTNRNKEIVSAGIVIPVDQARAKGKLVSCVVEEITQIMGLPNDSDDVYPSVFNDKSSDDLLSPLDGLLLKLLYHPLVKTGMTEKQVTPILTRIIHDYELDHTIQNSVDTIRQGELYPLLGY